MMSPLIIVGAPRSGTNILRDLVSDLPGFATWPCDEINYIWRYKNAGHPTDELQPGHAREAVKRYVKRKFRQIASATNCETVVEKTCANCLRIPFVNEVVPDARYLCITRDGVDAAVSAYRRWSAPLELQYIYQKARYVPLADMPYYASRYLANRVYRLVSKERRLASWGPVFEGMKDALQDRSLVEVCGMQWQACVAKSMEDLKKIAPQRVHYLRYEELVTKDPGVLNELSLFLGSDAEALRNSSVLATINDRSIGKGAASVSSNDLGKLRAIVDRTGDEAAYA